MRTYWLQRRKMSYHAIPELESLGIFGESPKFQKIHDFLKFWGFRGFSIKPTLAKKICPRARKFNLKKRREIHARASAQSAPNLCGNKKLASKSIQYRSFGQKSTKKHEKTWFLGRFRKFGIMRARSNFLSRT